MLLRRELLLRGMPGLKLRVMFKEVHQETCIFSPVATSRADAPDRCPSAQFIACDQSQFHLTHAVTWVSPSRLFFQKAKRA